MVSYLFTANQNRQH